MKYIFLQIESVSSKGKQTLLTNRRAQVNSKSRDTEVTAEEPSKVPES